MSDDIYRKLQEHLDAQPVGFPAEKTGADIRLLKRLFTPEEAELALHLTYQFAPTEEVAQRAEAAFPAEVTARLLDSMVMKGAIGWKGKDGKDHWAALPLVIGMYECQDGVPSPELLTDAFAYMKSKRFGLSFASVKPSQMRTIPINKSITAEHHVATYDQVRAIVDSSPGPFVVIPCICRKAKAMQGKPCGKVSRQETCLAFGDMAAAVLKRKNGREIEREEVLEILARNEEDGLVLQPSNSQKPEFICSCCGCCCGMLSFQKVLPRPVDFWTTTYQAVVEESLCVHCGTCVTRCQVGAVTMTGAGNAARVDHGKCIGCGLCVSTCPAQALRLAKRENAPVPPRDEETLIEEIKANKKGAAGQAMTFVKAALRMKP